MEWQNYINLSEEKNKLQLALTRLANQNEETRVALGNLLDVAVPEGQVAADELVFVYAAPRDIEDLVRRLDVWNAAAANVNRIRTREQILYSWQNRTVFWTNFDTPPEAGQANPPAPVYEVTPLPPDNKSISEEVHTITYLDANNGIVDWCQTTDNIIELANSKQYTQAQALSLMKKIVSHLATEDNHNLPLLDETQSFS